MCVPVTVCVLKNALTTLFSTKMIHPRYTDYTMNPVLSACLPVSIIKHQFPIQTFFLFDTEPFSTLCSVFRQFAHFFSRFYNFYYF